MNRYKHLPLWGAFKTMLLLLLMYFSLPDASAQKTYYSYQNGSWDDPNVWTLDPSGTVWINPSSGTPGNLDQAIIHNGRRIKANGANRQAQLLKIDEGGTLDLQTFTGHNFQTATGQGLLRIASTAFPAGNFTQFVAYGGGTIEYYTNAGLTLQQLIYNNLVINLSNPSDVVLLKNTNFLVHGTFNISSGIFQINDNTSQSLTLEVDSDLYIASAGKITVGSANQKHDFTLLGDFTNYGNVKFTTRIAPDYLNDTDPRVHVHFTNGKQNQSIFLAGPAVFYRIHCLKGIDDTYVLNLDATDTSYFKLYGPNDFTVNSPGTPPNIPNNNALGLEAGTLRLGQNIIIPALASSDDYVYDGMGVSPGTREYAVDLDATLWIDGAIVYTTYYRAPSANISAFNPIYGKLKITAGSLIDYSAQGIGLRITGQMIVEGGTVNATVIRTSAESTNHRGAYRQTAGSVTIRRDISTFDGYSASFHLGWSGTSFNMSGGLLEIMGSTPTDALRNEAKQFIFCIASDPQNISVTGGSIILHVPADRDARIATKGYFRNLTIISASSAHSAIQQDFSGSFYNEPITATPLVVTNNFSIAGAGVYNANNLDVTVGNGFNIASGASYVPGSNNTIFNGTAGQVFSNEGTITGGVNNLTIINSSNTSITENLKVSGILNINSGCFLQDMGKVITVNGNISNSGLHISQAEGRIQLEGAAAQTIGGNGNGIFGNLALNKTGGSASLTANISLNGNLRLANTMGVLDISYYNLHVSAVSKVYDDLTGTGTTFSSSKMIRTAGLRSDGGLTHDFNITGDVLFSMGAGAKYTPALINFSSAPSQWGSITVRPVNSKHSFVTDPDALSYYWRLNGNGFSGIVNGSITSKFVFVPGDVNGNVSLYIPGVFLSNSWTYINNVADVIDLTGEVYFRNQSQTDGDYTAGQIAAFGSVLTYYSRGGNWTDFSAGKYTAWTNDTVLNSPASALPGANNAVIIRAGHNITIPASDNVPKILGSLVIEKNAILDLTTTTGHNFGALEKEKVLGSGTLRISSSSGTAQFPIGDFGIFLSQGGGIVEYYSTGSQDFTIPVNNGAALPIPGYNKLRLSPGNGRIIFFPDVDLLVMDSLMIIGSASGTARFNNTSARNLTLLGNLVITGGTLDFNNNNPQTINAYNNISIAGGATFAVRDANTACDNQLNIYGDLQNNGTFDMSRTTSRHCFVAFRGLTNNQITGNGATTDFYTLTVDKGIDTSYVVTASPSNLTFSGAGQDLFINNGTFRINKSSLTIIPSTTTFDLPATGCLSVSNGTINLCTGANDNNDFFLSGKIEVLGGTMNIGTIGGNINNDIEFAGAGYPQIRIAGGALNVNGQIRRNPTVNTGALTFIQSGGIVTIYGRNRLTTRALLEVLNPGSQFVSSGNGSIVLVNGGGTTFGDLYLNPETYNLQGGTIQFGTGTTTSTTFNLFAACPLWSLTVDATGNAKAVILQSFPLTISGNLVIGAGASYLNTNGLQVTIEGNLQNLNPNNSGGLSSGGYRPGNANQVTIFNGSFGSQQIIGNGSNRTDLGNAIFSNTYSGGSVSLQNTTLRVDGDLTVQNGVLNNSNSRINLAGDLFNYATILSGSEYISFNGSGTAQQISGNDKSSYGSLLINNTSGVICNSEVTIANKLNLANGSFTINDNLLVFASNAIVEGTLDSTHLVISNGTLSDGGIRKLFNSGSQSFTFPTGIIGKYTPVNYSINSSSGGMITVKPVNAKHPALNDPPGNELSYYWNVVSSGFTNPTVTGVFNYTPDFVTGSESAYITGLYDNFQWQSGGGIVHPATHQFEFDNVTYMDGEYTAGAAANFTNKPKLYSRGSASWFGTSNWSLTPGGASCGCIPNGNPVFIQTGHVVTMTQNLAYSYSVDLASGAVLDVGQTLQHNLGHVTGNGTIRVASTSEGSFIFPGGDYTVFMHTPGSTVEYSGSGTLPPEIKTYQNVTYYGASTSKQIAAFDYKVLGSLWIREGALDNSGYNRSISLSGNWKDDISGGFIAGRGNAYFMDSALQNITGSGGETFYNLRIQKSGGEVTLNSAVGVIKCLYLDSGYIHASETNILSLLNTYLNAVEGGDSNSFVIGPMRKLVNNGDGFVFPTGDVKAGKYRFGPLNVSETQTSGSQYWLARYYYANPGDNGMSPAQLLQPIQAASNSEYWRIEGPSGGMANVKIRWDGLSDFIPPTTEGKQKLRIVEWRNSRWEKAGDLVDVTTQTIETSSSQSLDVGYFTLGLESLPTATITSGNASICNDGSQTAVNIVLTGDAPWNITYTINGGNTTIVSNIASSPYTLLITSDMLYPIAGEGDYIIALIQVKDKNNQVGVHYGAPAVIHLLKAPAPVITGKTYVNVNETGVVYSTPALAGSTYTWVVTAGSITAGQGTNTITVTWGSVVTTGQVQVTQVVTATGCQKVAYVNITIVATPVPKVTGPQYVCANDTSIYSTPPTVGHTYQWTVTGGTIISGSTNPTVQVQWGSGAIGKVKVIEDTGSAKGSDSLAITINPLPPANNAVKGDTICSGSMPQISISSVPGGLSYGLFSGATQVGAYVPSFGGGDITIHPDTAPIVNRTYKVRALNTETGCAVFLLNQASVIVYPSPAAALSASATQICQGTSVTFTATGGNSYSFIINGTSVQSGASNTYSTIALNNGDAIKVAAINNVSGCSDTSMAIVMTVNSLPIVSLNASTTAVCAGIPVTFTAVGAGQYVFQVNGSNKQSGDSATFTSSAIQNNDTVRVIGTNTVMGCSDTSAEIVMTVQALPVVTMNATATSVCSGTGITFNAGGADQYDFRLNGALVQSGTSASYTSTAPQNGDQVKVIGTNASTGCTDSSSAIILTVHSLPVVNLSTASTIACAGTAITFTASGADNYTFRVNAVNNVPGPDSVFITSTLQDADQVSVIGGNTSSGCMDTSNVVVMTIHPLPAVTLNASATGVCTGIQVIFTAANADQYTFQLNGADVQSGVSDTYTSSSLLNGDRIRVYGVALSTGCVDTTAAIAMSVHSIPVVSLQSNDTSICQGTLASFNASGADQYSFYLNGMLVQGPSATSSYTSQDLNDGDQIYSIGEISGCPGTSNMLSVSVHPLPAKPSISINGSTTFFFGDSVILSSSSAPGYLWSPGRESTRSIVVKTAGSYTVNVLSAQGCASLPADSVTIVVNFLYQKPVITIAGATSFCQGGNVGLSSSVGPGYLWSDGDTAKSIVVIQTGTYAVSLKDNQGHMSLPSDPVIVTVYENPVLGNSTVSNISCFGAATGTAQVDVTGGTLPYQYAWSDGQTTIQATGLVAGNYTVTITDAHSCLVSTSVNISQPTQITVIDSASGPRCPDAMDGKIRLTISGGVAPFTVQWIGGLSGTTISNLAAATYEATITDSNACVVTKSYVLADQMDNCLLIPNVITPDNNGFNDTWEIQGSYVYPEMTVEVFDRWGKRVFYSKGYPSSWDGTYNGKELPMDSYHYVIDLHNGHKPLIGIITIVR